MRQHTIIAENAWCWDANRKPRPDWDVDVYLEPGDLPSALRFWSVVLAVAVCHRSKDGLPASVEFRPSAGENSLSLLVDGTNYYLAPPPAEVRGWLFRVGRNLAAGSSIRGAWWWLKARLIRRESVGHITLDLQGGSLPRSYAKWTVVYRRDCLTFQSKSWHTAS